MAKSGADSSKKGGKKEKPAKKSKKDADN